MNSVNIFIDNKRIIFLPAQKKEQKETHQNYLVCLGSENGKVLLSFKQLIKSKNEDVLFIYGAVKTTFADFCGHFKLIEAAGGVIANTNNEYLFIYRFQKWDLPKGKLDKGETIRKAAVRECEEECAVTGLKIVRALKPTYHMYQIEKNWVIKKTSWFAMKTDFSGKLIPQKEEGITNAEWIGQNKISKVAENTYPAIRSVLKEMEII
jgi:ADP-ribose pyrophosphatase YjhB (NUDIX family)